MDEKEQEQDPTKEAFFSDLEEVEKDISSEAYNLVEHALSLLESHYYDDSIEALRQAIGLYSQINKQAEVEALKQKISNIYIIKERNFRETEIESNLPVKSLPREEEPVIDKDTTYEKADRLIVEGLQSVTQRKFDHALDNYEEAINLLQKINRLSEIENVNKLIEDCYNKKAEILRAQRDLSPKESVLSQSSIDEVSSPENLRVQRLKAYEDLKLKESSYSTQAYEIIGKAAELAKFRQYDQAIQLYENGAELFREINWINEVNRIENTILQLENEKEKKKLEMEVIAAEEKRIQELQKEQEASMLEKAKVQEEQKIQAMRAQAINEKKRQEALFKAEIAELVNNAEKIAHNYESEMKKGIKKGKIVKECAYPEVIRIYELIKEKVLEYGWNDQAQIYSNQINIFQNKLKKDIKLREIEEQKLKSKIEYEESFKVGKKSKINKLEIDRKIEVEEQRRKEQIETETKKQNEIMANQAERMAREYNAAFKKAVKDGNPIIESKYPEIIAIYTTLKNIASQKGWDEDIAIYATHIRKYSELHEKNIKIRELEAKKIEEQKLFEESFKLQKSKFQQYPQQKLIEESKSEEIEDGTFQNQISKIVDYAEKKAREYDINLKKGLKKGELLETSPYQELIDIYIDIKKKVMEHGWDDQVPIYSSQIKLYQEKLEKDKKLREIEAKKIVKQREYQEMQKQTTESTDVEKLIEIEKDLVLQRENENLEKEIDNLIDKIEKEAREYELAIKRGKFEKECPYLKIAEFYGDIRDKVYSQGWKDEAKVYTNQIIYYQEKFEKDVKLRELEAKKSEDKRKFEESLKVTIESKPLKLQEIKEMELKDAQEDNLIDRAMNLITEVENEVRSYELSLRREILTLTSPYEKAIANYEKARKMFQKMGWKDEAKRLINTIKLYKEKKLKDNKLREIELEKLKKEKVERPIFKEAPTEGAFVREKKIIDYENLRKDASKEAAPILEMINKAERLAKEYEIAIKKGILNVEPKYEQVILIYKKTKKRFEEIGWLDQAEQLDNSIKFYEEKMITDTKLRDIELEKLEKEDDITKKRLLETKLAREAEAELLNQRMQAVELKRKQTEEYEAKKDLAFKLMDQAKKELQQDNFDVAIKYYQESQEIFILLKWTEGINMVKNSIQAIQQKKDRLVREQKLLKEKEAEKLIMEAQIKEQISKAKDLREIQQEQRRKEFLELQREKEKEREISEQAYKLLEEGTKLKNKKRYEGSYEKYVLARDLFKKIGWQHEVSRINNDLLFILKKEMKQTEKIQAFQQKKEEEELELKILLKEADLRSKELEVIKKEEKRKHRAKIINEELEQANNIIKNLRYNEGILKLKEIIQKLGKTEQEKLVKQINKQIEVLENASQVPLIAIPDIENGENLEKYILGVKALDNAQISLSNNLKMRAISELNEAKYNLKDTNIGKRFLPIIEERIKTYKEESGIAKTSEPTEKSVEKVEDHDLRDQIAQRRAERRRRVDELMKNKD